MHTDSLTGKSKRICLKLKKNTQQLGPALQTNSFGKTINDHYDHTQLSHRKVSKPSKSKRIITDHFDSRCYQDKSVHGEHGRIVKQIQMQLPHNTSKEKKKFARSSSLSRPYHPTISTEYLRKKDTRNAYISQAAIGIMKRSGNEKNQSKSRDVNSQICRNYNQSQVLADSNSTQAFFLKSKFKIRGEDTGKATRTYNDCPLSREKSKKKQIDDKSIKKRKHIKIQECSSEKYFDSYESQQIRFKNTTDCTPKLLSMQDLQIDNMIGEGTFGKVFRCKVKKTGDYVAVKKVFQDPKYKNREIQIVSMLQSPFTMRVISTFTASQGAGHWLNIVMDCYEGDLHALLKRDKLTNFDIKLISYQVFRGLMYIHSKDIAHRDIKPHNILLKNRNAVICDFGSAKILQPTEANLSYICSRCYRAPELIFGAKNYNTQIDVWSTGCVLVEMLHGGPLFVGNSSVDHLIQIIKVLGTPSKPQVLAMNPDYDLNQYKFPKIKKKPWNTLFPSANPLLLDLINKIMVYAPSERLTASGVLAHQYYDELRQETTAKMLKIKYNLDLLQFTREQFSYSKDKVNILMPAWLRKQKY